MICFSQDCHHPVIWSHYADNHKGLALGFDLNESILMKVGYRKSRKRLPEFDDLAEDRWIPVIKDMLATKFDHWKYETEISSFLALPVPDDKGLYFAEFDKNIVLREVVVGAHSEVTTKQVIEACKNRYNPKIRHARLAFNSFRVVEQRNPAMYN